MAHALAPATTVLDHPLLAAPTVLVYVFEYPKTVFVHALATAVELTPTVLDQALAPATTVLDHPLDAAPTVFV